MKKETKFKVWDKINDKFLSDRELKDLNIFSHINNPGSPYIFNEYTGLKDKNGVEIYEGYIIKWKNRDGALIKNSVGFADGGFVMDGPRVINDNTYYTPLAVVLSNDVEVIGNIYENPDLIKSELDFLD